MEILRATNDKYKKLRVFYKLLRIFVFTSFKTAIYTNVAVF